MKALATATQAIVASGVGQVPRYLDVRGAALYLSLSERALYHRKARRTIPFIKQGGRLLFDRQALDRWMKREGVDATEPLRVSTNSSGILCRSEV